MKIPQKVIKLQMFENLHKNVNENMFSFTFFMQIFTSFSNGPLNQKICYSFTLLISYIHLKWWPSSFRLHQIFPILMVLCFFSQMQQVPGPDFNKVGKSLLLITFANSLKQKSGSIKYRAWSGLKLFDTNGNHDKILKMLKLHNL